MDCPICGEEIPPGSDACPTCGADSDESFLTEAFADLANGKQAAAPAPQPARKRPEPSALKPTKRLDWTGILALTGGGVLVVTLILIAIFLMPGGAKVALANPEQAVEAYYEALSHGDLQGTLSLVADAFQPTETAKAELEKAFRENTYEVSDLAVKVISSDKQSASVSIQNVKVTIKPNNGGSPVTHSLVDEILQPAQQNDPEVVMLVMLDFYDNTWTIASQPYGGWSPENIWALGRPEKPSPAP